jgi:hypothetical protein
MINPPHKNRLYIKGLGYPRQDFSDAGNVVQLPVNPPQLKKP